MRQISRDHSRVVMVVMSIIMPVAMLMGDGLMHMAVIVLFCDKQQSTDYHEHQPYSKKECRRFVKKKK